jgi:hypothetical protein
MMGYYILDGKVPKSCKDASEWGEWFNNCGDSRIIAKTEVGESVVSTVFFGIDHNFGNGPPLLFETMIFGGKFDEECWRCSTWEEAEARHGIAVAMCKDSK